MATFIETLYSGKFAPKLDDELQLPFDCNPSIIEDAINNPDQKPSCQCSLTEQDVQALDYLNILEPFLMNMFRQCSSEEIEHLLKDAYPIDDYQPQGPVPRPEKMFYEQWLSKFTLPVQEQMVLKYLPTPLDLTIKLPDINHQKVKNYLKEHFDFDTDSVPEYPHSSWMIAGSFVTAMCDPTNRTIFNDIDFWVSGEDPEKLTAALAYLLSRKDYSSKKLGYYNYGNWTFNVKDLITGKDVSMSINCAGSFTSEDLLRYFDLDPCKYLFNKDCVLTTVRAKNAVETRSVLLPDYYENCPVVVKRGDTYLTDVPYSNNEILQLRSFLNIGYHRISMRIEKYQKKGFTFTYGPPADIEILDKYLPYGSWIADNYLHDVSTPCFFNPGPMTVDVGSSRITIEDTQAANLLSPKTELEFEALIKNKLDDPSLAELNGYGELRTYYSYDGGCHELTDKVLVPPGLYFPEPEDIPNNKSPKWTSDKTLFACSLRNGDNNMNRYKPILQELFEHRHFHFMDKKEIFLSHRLGANLDSNITRQVEMGFTYLGLYAWSFHCTDMLTKELMLKYPPKNYS